MNRDLSSLPALGRPTRVRYGVLGFACALSMITYLDRLSWGSAAPSIVAALGLDSVADLKWAAFAFSLAYAVFEVPSGWLGDVFGPRRTLIRIVLWWSLFTALTGTVTQTGFWFLGGLGVLVLIRFLFGVGEAGAYPNITRALHNWFPVTERGLSQGTVWMAGRLMGGLTPLIWLAVVEMTGWSWRAAFWVFGAVGIVWCVAFALWFRNRPGENPAVNEAELSLIEGGRGDEAGHAHVPWGRLLGSGNLWALCLMYFCGAYGWYFNVNYLPSYLETQYGVLRDSTVGAVYKGGPLLMGAVSCVVGGYLSDRFVRLTGNRRWGRRRYGVAGHALCGLCYMACLITPTAGTFALAISLAAFWNDLTMGPAWATCQDIGRRYAAIVAGCMNTIGNLGGAAAAWLTGVILDRTLAAHAAAQGLAVNELSEAGKVAGMQPGYQINFLIFGVVYFLAALLWLRIDATRPVAPEES